MQLQNRISIYIYITKMAQLNLQQRGLAVADLLNLPGIYAKKAPIWLLTGGIGSYVYRYSAVAPWAGPTSVCVIFAPRPDRGPNVGARCSLRARTQERVIVNAPSAKAVRVLWTFAASWRHNS
ncbi:hypothetical protein VTK56DRAFT_5486 [Thermocarpiscus australiensis]